MENLKNMYDRQKCLSMCRVLMDIPGSKKQIDSLLTLYDDLLKNTTNYTLYSPFKFTLTSDHIKKNSPYGVLVHFSPQSFLTCHDMSNHMNRQYCWINDRLIKKRTKDFDVEFYDKSYFLMFDPKKKSDKTRINAEDMAEIMLSESYVKR